MCARRCQRRPIATATKAPRSRGQRVYVNVHIRNNAPQTRLRSAHRARARSSSTSANLMITRRNKMRVALSRSPSRPPPAHRFACAIPDVAGRKRNTEEPFLALHPRHGRRSVWPEIYSKLGARNWQTVEIIEINSIVRAKCIRNAMGREVSMTSDYFDSILHYQKCARMTSLLFDVDIACSLACSR